MSDEEERITFAVIGGSQAHKLIRSGRFPGERLERVETPFGSSGVIYLVKAKGESFYFLPRHGEKSYSIGAPFVNYRANIYALKELGVKRILAWSGPGALSRKYSPGDFVIVDDLLDETKSRETTFLRFRGLGFVRQNPVFCPTLRRIVKEVLEELDADFAYEGTYVATEGPRLETPAEVRKFALLGGDLVGQTVAPEVFLARELEMCYAVLCYVTNYAEGIMGREFKEGILFEGLSTKEEHAQVTKAFKRYPEIILKVAERLTQAKNICHCQQSMLRYKKRGDIGENWQEWLSP